MEDESVSGLAWWWVIEALASSPSVDLRLLYELATAGAAQPDSGSVSGSAATEAAALRCLEALCASTLPSATSTDIAFDNTHTCHHVLQHILRQTANLRQHVSEELTTSVRTFVDLKKPSFPISTLQLLKDMILQGSHPLATTLKEISGLPFRDQLELNIPSVRDDLFNTLSTSVSTAHATLPLLQQVNMCSASHRIGHHLGQANPPNADSWHSGNDTNGCFVDDQLMEIDGIRHTGDTHALPGKKLRLEKQCGIQSQRQSPVFPDGTEDDPIHHPSKSNETRIGNSNVETVALLAKTSEEKHISGMAPVDCGHDPDETHAALNNPVFLSSQFVFSQDSILFTDAEENLCMKCNEGGKLLACCGSTCPLTFHESCIASDVGFDDEGNFYCPICAYSRAVSEYIRAKEKVFAARKNLALFLGGGTNHHLKHGRSRSPNDIVNPLRHEGDNGVIEGLS